MMEKPTYEGKSNEEKIGEIVNGEVHFSSYDYIEKEVQEKAGHLKVSQQKMLRDYLLREEADPNNGVADYTPADEGMHWSDNQQSI